MEAIRDKPPEYATRSPETIAWPTVPQHAPEQQQNLPPSDIKLPGLKTVLSPDFEQLSPRQSSIGSPQHRQGSPTSVRSLPRIDPGYTTLNYDTRRSVDAVVTSPIETGSVMSVEDRAARSTSVSMDDPDVRSAVEGLAGLGNPNFARSSRCHSLRISSHASSVTGARASEADGEAEPLLELVSQAHPWVGGTIKGSLSAYSTTKYYSPRIVQYGVSLIERNIGTPVACAVGSVSAYTGVEAGLRRHLDSRRPNDLERGMEKSNGAAGTHMDIDGQEGIMFRQGFEQLPPYGASRPPSYREEASPASTDRALERPHNNRSWSSQIVYTASGLSVALSTTSRQSLRFCLRLLAQQTGYVNHLTKALHLLLTNYEEARQKYHSNNDSVLEKGERPATPDHDENARELANQIKQHCDNIWQSLQYVVNAVSNYAGGALPQNAREFVRVQLMSLPQRWRVVSDATNAESETTRAAQRMIDFAGQGLDMMTQVSGVLQATLESAERWLAAIGRSDQQHHQGQDNTMQDGPPRAINEKS